MVYTSLLALENIEGISYVDHPYVIDEVDR